MCGRRIILSLALTSLAAWGQKPVISSVTNAASYLPASGSPGSIEPAEGSIVSIFGTNLAASTLQATTPTLPTILGGTSVTIYGQAAPLFYVSPTQINFQVPEYPWLNYDVVVTTTTGVSDPYAVTPNSSIAEVSLGIFTLDGSGCGRGAILNAHSDGTVSLNSRSDSISPGEYLSVYGTGAGQVYFYGNGNNYTQIGSPTPLSPLTVAQQSAGALFDDSPTGAPAAWSGRAPGLIGVDQFNVLVPATVREGCAVPLQLGDGTISQPVTVAIHNGGGPCVDPPEAGYGQIMWERTVSTTAANVVTENRHRDRVVTGLAGQTAAAGSRLFRWR